MNCQLYRSNVLLGGQMKYDLILDSDGAQTYVKDLHITPISSRAPYNKYTVDNLFFYNHHENIVSFYKKFSGSFYNDFINPALASLHPLPENYNGDVCDTTYETGCRRMSYQFYNKQFNFFCPLWLEKIDDISKLSFEIQIKTDKSRTPIFTRELKFSNGQKITQYFNNYIKHIKLDVGCDWVFNIDENNSWVRGLNIKTGKLDEINLLTLYDNLTHRERPLLEFNNIIINELNKNYLIVPQLFNFNFCFNLEDVFNRFVYDSIKNHQIYINIVAKIDGTELDIYDIFSNHKYIERKTLQWSSIDGDNDLSNMNVLDYLNDYNNIDLIDKNKIIQNTCHWRLANGEHFNLYQGFAPVYEKDGEFKTMPYYSENIADIDSVELNEYNEFQVWCNNYIIENNDSIGDWISDVFKLKHNYIFSRFTNNCIVKNIKYKATKDIKDTDIVILRAKENYNEIANIIIKKMQEQGSFWNYYYKPLGDKSVLVCYLIDDINKIIIFAETNNSNLLYKNFISNISASDSLFGIFTELVPIKSDLKLVSFYNGLIQKPTKGPSLNIKETDYYKVKQNKKMVRFFGKIKPYFIRKGDLYKNYQYYKLKLNDIKDQYVEFIKTKFQPKYPSINYFAIGEKQSINYGDYNEEPNNYIEQHNYTFNKIINLIPELNFEYTYTNANEFVIEDSINNSFLETYSKLLENINIDKNEVLKYIKNQYKLINSNIDIITLEDGENKYKYNIQYKLI